MAADGPDKKFALTPVTAAGGRSGARYGEVPWLGGPARTLISQVMDPANAHLLQAWPQAMLALTAALEAGIRQAGPNASPDAQARAAALVLAERFGGRVLRLPRPTQVRSLLRDAAVYREWDGRNHEALAAKHNIHLTKVYRLLRQQRALHAAARRYHRHP